MLENEFLVMYYWGVIVTPLGISEDDLSSSPVSSDPTWPELGLVPSTPCSSIQVRPPARV